MKAFLFATMLEAGPFIAKGAWTQASSAPFRLFSRGDDYCIITGIGKTPAACASWHCAVTLGCSLLVNCGAAGALDHTHREGDIVIPSKIVEADRILIPSRKMPEYYPTPDPLFATDGSILVTRDIPALTPEDRAESGQSGQIIDMEAAGVAQASLLTEAAFCCIKIITDTPDTHGDIISEVKKQSIVLADFLYRSALFGDNIIFQ